MPFHIFRWLAAAGFLAPAAAFAADSGNVFNPRISLILDGSYARYSSEAPFEVPGFLLDEEAGLRAEGLSLGETELVLEANVDDLFHAWVSVALGEDDSVGVEEAYVDTLALPHGFTMKLGRFFSDIGYQNRKHAHAWDFVDAPLVYRTFFGTQLGDDGAQVRWVAPLPVFVDVGIELFRGAAFPGGGEHRSGIPGKTAFLHVGDDLGTSWSYRFGLSYLATNADDRRTGEHVATSFSGRSRVAGVDFVAKWAPNRNAKERNAVLQAEFFRRSERGDLVFDPDGSAEASAYDGRQWGFYVQGIYQFVRQWRAGLRYDRVHADNNLGNPASNTALALLADNGSDPERWSAMVDWSHSDFSRVRLQFSGDGSRPDGDTDNQVLLQYIFSLGSHPAHTF